ncbi:glycosyltransferase family 2 protein [Subtercola sp. PAMC28395]|uniref:glycosyltransferase family 2 protein n=1 Tax=Subtercola sp. PAMC28395 TaxID=2846775 RepID=UPI001C0B52F1|nr:glycosyltransferase family A protein [Subtercola sp. PAMC28395]QWT25023.1 glycosyltransferase family 2 protein [Subtercola sp. PAMC28395]
MSPRVSVVVPAYNNADYIALTIESILAQTFEDFELIIADHSSTDNTKEVIARYSSDPRITMLDTPSGGGALRNWNRVTEAATGEYIKLVCGDDLLYPDSLLTQVAAIESDPAVTLVASTRDIVDARGTVVVARRGLAGLRGTVRGAVAVRRTVVVGSNIFGEPACVLIRRSTLKKVGLWDSQFPYLIDETTYARVLLEGDFLAVPEPLAAFRISDSQWSVRLVREQSAQASAFHRWLRAEHPAVISALDLRVGNARAWLMSHVRRFAYLWLRRRMNTIDE